ncbi:MULTISPECIES: site-specific DNA-methyltransferase [Xanthomonas]|uniref:site-specific DNA-methyltransferase n=1 Tax=Xanthomonas TaxID=338 RepID=UPI00096F82C7|nr:site-specific DNA-methyltransferase [Xanthomonas campestris]MCC5094348.1 site-specific DNA-methyltransferase [Xanthomonas campestris pv. incanae]MEA9612928.1 DNA methyltransferase [Xanthomonas campestris pv. incanae]MEA9621098.1 DNA methyltransferase [Xanthomonas campestris pv. incanae]RFF39175.1 site-specific DNA-methyltransferase [Xanthomonas campestris pv. incanae]WDJ11023.1 site-specific DNA-methyltransferase [Xanthomonas campestris pv. incanae]
MAMKKTEKHGKSIEQITHTEAKRKNIPTVEHQSVMQHHEQAPVQVAYPRANRQWLEELCALHNAGKVSPEFQQRLNRDLDPQLIWRGKDQQDWSDLVVNAPPLYIQEKVKPKALIDDLRRQTEARREAAAPQQDMLDLFGDFNGLPEGADRTEFYQHEGHWQNRMILGDSLQVMASLAEREGLRGKVQCIYLDPPYGIKFNSNFQWSTTSRDVKDGADHITREPEQVKAFRDTWRNGIHSYLTYLRDRLVVARDLLSKSGSIFVQIGDENVHRVRALMDEVFGEGNLVSTIAFKKTSGTGSNYLENIYDYALWYARDLSQMKYRQPLVEKGSSLLDTQYTSSDELRQSESYRDPRYMPGDMSSQGASEAGTYPFKLQGREYRLPPNTHWKASRAGIPRLAMAGRLVGVGQRLRYKRFADDFPVVTFSNSWDDTIVSGYADPKVYVVQTSTKVIQRCLLMATDPGDLVLDPTCGSGTTAYVSEQWGRRWITIDTSRVALALARARIMGARYPFYLLADSREGQLKEAEITRGTPSSQSTYDNIAHGFVYERVPHITLKSIANNAEIDVIWEKFQTVLEPLRETLNETLGRQWQEWEIPREGDAEWSDVAKKLHADWWQQRIARQKEIDASIAAKAEFAYLYDKPYEDKKKVRVAGPFTVESMSPHRVLGVDEEDNLIDHVAETQAKYGQDFTSLILDNLRTAGVQQAHKADKIEFTALEPWPGELVCAEGRYLENGQVKRAGILVGPEFGTVTRADLVDAAREAGDANFDVVIACAFNYDAPASEFSKLGRINVLKARMNADLHMAEDLKNTGKGNLFVIFGEPDVDVLDTQGRIIRRYDGKRDVIDVPADGQLVVKINGVDVFHPSTGEVRSDGADGIACWFLDTDYNEESFFVRHAYFLGANDPYKALKTTLKAEIDSDAWATLNCDTSRPFPKPSNGRFAVKVINHLGDEVMKVFKVS